MKLRALVVAASLVAACGTDHTPQPDQPLPTQYAVTMKAVDDSSTTMQQLYARVPIDRPNGIAAAIDHWRTEDGAARTDYYITGASPQAIEAYVASEPTLSVPADRQLAFEQIDGHRWRTYLLFPAVELDASAIAHAHAGTDPNTERPIVTIDFTPAGARQFGDLTARIAGHKLAVLVDGRVVSAPVINGAITSGHATVSFDPSATDITASALAQALDK
jgi:preprotein translocase subunit SecD